MPRSEVSALLNSVVDAICDVDKECSTLRNGIEHGLVNVELEFAERCLTEEPLIASLVRERLNASGFHVHPGEVPYPGNRKRCDVVINLTDTSQLWLEVKLAWKAWFNCIGPPVYSNRAYATYLDGRGRRHSLRHDFERLQTTDLPSSHSRGVCLIGFDCANEAMDEDVAAVVRQAQVSAPWELAVERHWPDRRHRDFRINVSIWLLSYAGEATSGDRERQGMGQPRIDHKRALDLIERFVMTERWGALWTS